MNWFIYSLLAVLGWGIWGLMLKISVDRIGWFLSSIFSVLIELILLVCIWIVVPFTVKLDTVGIISSIGAGIGGVIGLVMFNQALSIGKLSIVSPLTSFYPAITVLLAVFLLGETLKLTQIIGILFAIIAIILIVI